MTSRRFRTVTVHSAALRSFLPSIAGLQVRLSARTGLGNTDLLVMDWRKPIEQLCVSAEALPLRMFICFDSDECVQVSFLRDAPRGSMRNEVIFSVGGLLRRPVASDLCQDLEQVAEIFQWLLANSSARKVEASHRSSIREILLKHSFYQGAKDSRGTRSLFGFDVVSLGTRFIGDCPESLVATTHRVADDTVRKLDLHDKGAVREWLSKINGTMKLSAERQRLLVHSVYSAVRDELHQDFNREMRSLTA